MAFISSGELLAVGLKSGEVLVISLSNMKIWAKKRDRGSCVNDIRYCTCVRYEYVMCYDTFHACKIMGALILLQ